MGSELLLRLGGPHGSPYLPQCHSQVRCVHASPILPTSWYPSQPPGIVLPLPLAQLVIKHPTVTPAVLVKAQIRDFPRHLFSAKAIPSQVPFPSASLSPHLHVHLPSAPWYLLKTSVPTAQCQAPHGDLQMRLRSLSLCHAKEDPDVPPYREAGSVWVLDPCAGCDAVQGAETCSTWGRSTLSSQVKAQTKGVKVTGLSGKS